MTTATQTAAHFYAAGTAYRTLFTKARTSAEVEKYLKLGYEADLALINVPIHSPEDAVIKLSLAIEWLANDASENALCMLESVLAYTKGQCGSQSHRLTEKTETSPNSIKHQVELWCDDKLVTSPEAKCLQDALVLADNLAASAQKGKYGKGEFKVAVQELSNEGNAERQIFEEIVSGTEKQRGKEKHSIKTNRSSHPTWVDGVLYPSQAQAAKALNITRYELMKKLVA